MNLIAKAVMAAAALATISPAPALADPRIGSRIDRSDRGLTGRFNPRRAESVRPAINAYFRCKASLDRARAQSVLDLEYMSDEQKEMIDEVGPPSMFARDEREDCFSMLGGGGVQIGADAQSAVGAFAEYFVTRQYDAEDAARLATLTREDWQIPAMTPRNGNEMIGLCTAQAAGSQVFRLLETEPASDGEGPAIQEVVPYLAPCLTDGLEVSFDASSLRAMLAHSLYKALSGQEALEKAAS